MFPFVGRAKSQALLCIFILFGLKLFAQSPVTTVESLGAIPASQVLSGLGWNLSPANPWEFQAAAAAGAKHVRFQCSWGDAYGGRGGGGELQSPPPANVSQGYELPSGCAQGISLSKQYGMKPTILAAYGPPFQQILTLTTTSAVASGATSIRVNFVSGVGGDTLSGVAYPFDYLTVPSMSGFLSPAHSYAGTLISGITLSSATQATISLASATQVAISAGTTLVVNRVLYPSVATNNAADPSIQAYVGFVRFLGNQCASAGIACEIEIWNEPPWPDDCWDNRLDCFDQGKSPGLTEQYFGPNWGFVAALQSTPPIPGVTYDWAGTHKSGDGTVLGSNMSQYAGLSFNEPASAVAVESLHPYGNDPEDNLWNEPCLVALKTTWSWGSCNTVSTSSSNAAQGEARSITAKAANPSYGIAHAITETGFAGTAGDDAHKARFIMRQFIGFMAADIQFIEFYRMFDTDPNSDFSFMRYANGTPSALPAYTAIAGLMSDLAALPSVPVTPVATTSLVTVQSYSGTYPLDIAHFIGSRPGDTANSDFVTIWQRSSVSGNLGWGSLASPPATPVTLTIPAGMHVVQVVNLDTRAQIPFTNAGQLTSFKVSDDPIELLVEPNAPTPTLAVTVPAMPYGSASTPLTANISYPTAAAAIGALGFVVDNGPSIPANCSGTASTRTCTATSPTKNMAVGTHTVVASLSADANFSAAAASTTFAVSPQTPALAVTAASLHYGTPSTMVAALITYSGVTPPTAPLGFNVDGGLTVPATCTGSASPRACTVSLGTAGLAVGNHRLTASLASDANYNASSAVAVLTVVAQSPTVNVTPSSIPYGTASVPLTAQVSFVGLAAPTGALSFSIDGGSAIPASCAGTNSPLTCTASAAAGSLSAGAHTVLVSVAADANYSTASASATLTVTPALKANLNVHGVYFRGTTNVR